MQPDLFNQDFDGPCYDEKLDKERLTGQILKIYQLMSDGEFRTLSEIRVETGYGEASISAQLRHLRKERFGKHTIEKKRRGNETNGLWEYKLVINQSSLGTRP